MNVCMFCLQSVLSFGAVVRETGTESGITNRVTITTVLLLHGVTPPQPEKKNLSVFHFGSANNFFMTYFFNCDLKSKG